MYITVAMKEKSKSYLREEFVFFVLSVGKENLNQDQINFSRPQNMVIFGTSLSVSANHNFFYPNKRTQH